MLEKNHFYSKIYSNYQYSKLFLNEKTLTIISGQGFNKASLIMCLYIGFKRTFLDIHIIVF